MIAVLHYSNVGAEKDVVPVGIVLAWLCDDVLVPLLHLLLGATKTPLHRGNALPKVPCTSSCIVF